MKIFIDTNVLISAILNPNGISNKAYIKATTYPNIGLICEQNIDELKRIFINKFPDRIIFLDKFLRLAQLTIIKVPIPREPYIKEAKLRDIKDRPILHAVFLLQRLLLRCSGFSGINSGRAFFLFNNHQ